MIMLVQGNPLNPHLSLCQTPNPHLGVCKQAHHRVWHVAQQNRHPPAVTLIGVNLEGPSIRAHAHEPCDGAAYHWRPLEREEEGGGGRGEGAGAGNLS